LPISISFLLSKLSSIEDALKRKRTDTSKPSYEIKGPSEPIKEKPISLFEAITLLFKK